MRNIFFCCFVISVLAIAPCGYLLPCLGDPLPLKIGIPLPLTGEAASFGTAIKNGIELAVADKKLDSIKVLFEDDQYLPSKSVSAAKKLIEVDHVNVLFSVGSTPSHSLAPLSEKSNVPLFAWASDPTVAANKRYVIRTYPSSNEEGNAIAQQALKNGYQAVAAFYSQNDYTQAVTKAVAETLGAQNVMYQEQVPPNSIGFVPSLLKARGKKAKAYFICLTPGKAGLFAKQLRQIQIEDPIFGCEALNDDAEVQTAHGALHGAWFVTNAVSEDFRRRYQEKFGNLNLISAAALHYDLVSMLAKLYRAGMSSDDIVNTFMSLGSQNGAVPNWTPTKTPSDQFVKFDFVVKDVKEFEAER